jgi:hypothetical protein
MQEYNDFKVSLDALMEKLFNIKVWENAYDNNIEIGDLTIRLEHFPFKAYIYNYKSSRVFNSKSKSCGYEDYLATLDYIKSDEFFLEFCKVSQRLLTRYKNHQTFYATAQSKLELMNKMLVDNPEIPKETND